VNKIAADPELRKHFLRLAQRISSGTPEDLQALLKKDWDYYGELVKKLNLKLD